MRDMLGNTIKRGDIVAHATRRSSFLYLTCKLVERTEGDVVWLMWSDSFGVHRSAIRESGKHPYIVIVEAA